MSDRPERVDASPLKELTTFNRRKEPRRVINLRGFFLPAPCLRPMAGTGAVEVPVLPTLDAPGGMDGTHQLRGEALRHTQRVSRRYRYAMQVAVAPASALMRGLRLVNPNRGPKEAEQGPSGYRYLPTIDGGGRLDGTQ